MLTKGICKPKILTLSIDDTDTMIIVGLSKHQKWEFELLEGYASRVFLSNHNVSIIIPLDKFEEKWEVIT